MDPCVIVLTLSHHMEEHLVEGLSVAVGRAASIVDLLSRQDYKVKYLRLENHEWECANVLVPDHY